jgi:hypothetical protein
MASRPGLAREPRARRRRRSAPTCIPVMRSLISDFTVSMTIGMEDVSGRFLSVAQTSQPEICGIVTSSRITSGCVAVACSMPSRPLRASTGA